MFNSVGDLISTTAPEKAEMQTEKDFENFAKGVVFFILIEINIFSVLKLETRDHLSQAINHELFNKVSNVCIKCIFFHRNEILHPILLLSSFINALKVKYT